MTHPNLKQSTMKPVKPTMLSRFRNKFSKLIRAERGTATTEFVIYVPLVLAIFFAAFETGIFMTRMVMLERSVDVVMRSLRVGLLNDPNTGAGPSPDQIKDLICSYSGILRDCRQNITLEMMPVSPDTWIMPSTRTTCVDRSEPIQPTLRFSPGTTQEITLVRVCVLQQAMFPTTGIGLRLPKDPQGAYSLVTMAAFVNER